MKVNRGEIEKENDDEVFHGTVKKLILLSCGQ